ncbi:MAG: hypothetical protein ACKOCW_10010, partial [Planctomycetaceae bacterium]
MAGVVEGRESRRVGRLWTNSLLDRTDAIAAVQLPKKPEVFLHGKSSGRLFPRPFREGNVMDQRSETSGLAVRDEGG